MKVKIRSKVTEKKETTVDPLLVTGKEVAIMLNISERMVVKLKQEGKLPFVKIGTLVRYSPTGIQAYIDSQTVLSEGGEDERS